MRTHINVTGGGAKPDSSLLGQLQTAASGKINEMAADHYVDSSEVTDNYLWTTVKHDGKPAFLGLLSHWWDQGGAADLTPKK